MASYSLSQDPSGSGAVKQRSCSEAKKSLAEGGLSVGKSKSKKVNPGKEAYMGKNVYRDTGNEAYPVMGNEAYGATGNEVYTGKEAYSDQGKEAYSDQGKEAYEYGLLGDEPYDSDNDIYFGLVPGGKEARRPGEKARPRASTSTGYGGDRGHATEIGDQSSHHQDGHQQGQSSDWRGNAVPDSYRSQCMGWSHEVAPNNYQWGGMGMPWAGPPPPFWWNQGFGPPWGNQWGACFPRFPPPPQTCQPATVPQEARYPQGPSRKRPRTEDGQSSSSASAGVSEDEIDPFLSGEERRELLSSSEESEEEGEGPPPEKRAFIPTEKTTKFLRSVSTKPLKNERRKATMNRYPLPSCDPAHPPKLDEPVACLVPKAAKSYDSFLSKLQCFTLDAAGPLL